MIRTWATACAAQESLGIQLDGFPSTALRFSIGAVLLKTKGADCEIGTEVWSCALPCRGRALGDIAHPCHLANPEQLELRKP